MCGIAGAVWSNDGEPIAAAVLQTMTRTLHSRGPDGEGFLLRTGARGGAALGHRRLAVIDLATGDQPLSNENGTVWVVFNGEIYNFRELRSELQRAGHEFRTQSDTEVIVHLYEEYGDECVERLRGMFAFAVWNERTGDLLLARDRMGQKPLVYRQERQRILFASQLRALLAVPGVPRDIDPGAIHAFLRYQCIPGPACALRGFDKLPPAHLASYRNGKLTVRRYWSPVVKRTSSIPTAECAERLRRELTRATESQMVSDVPVGAFLSGGIDSTIVVGLMTQCVNAMVKTFSIGFRDRQCDESEFARQTAAYLGTDHRELILETPSPDMVVSALSAYDEPFADNSAIPTYLVSELARSDVTVSLTGDGGDELFGGYPVYRRLRWLQRFDGLPGPLRRLVLSPAAASIVRRSRSPKLMKLSRLLAALADSPEGRLTRTAFGGFSPSALPELMKPEFAAAVRRQDSEDCIVAACAHCDDDDLVSRAMLVHQSTYLPDVLLVKVDVASMAHGLECRSPFLDHGIVEMANALPRDVKMPGGTLKGILKSTFADFFPPKLAARPKQGFSVPLDRWIRTIWSDTIRDALSASDSFWSTLLERSVVDGMLRAHMEGSRDLGHQLWTLFCLEHWHRTYIRGGGPGSSRTEQVDRIQTQCAT